MATHCHDFIPRSEGLEHQKLMSVNSQTYIDACHRLRNIKVLTKETICLELNWCIVTKILDTS